MWLFFIKSNNIEIIWKQVVFQNNISLLTPMDYFSFLSNIIVQK